MSGTDQRLRHVLAGLSFPARRWEVIVEAEHYGADARFESFAALLWALERAQARARAA